ncbi:MAG: 50S ribosomal protein L6 [Deltaproteobacteria bacterium]|nr:50S ribosomal protein L6 [Deltaproteobacteria bacterium]
MSELEPFTGRQSRVGKKPIELPKGVDITLGDGQISVKGPKGVLSRKLPRSVDVARHAQQIVVRPQLGLRDGPQMQGLARALVANMVAGVVKPFAKSLDFYGTGYRAELSGQDLTLSLGLSHQVKLRLPDMVKARVETIDEAGQKRPRLHLESIDKELLGQTAAEIRSFRPPEPYKGKGGRYTGEKIREKAGKAGKGRK